MLLFQQFNSAEKAVIKYVTVVRIISNPHHGVVRISTSLLLFQLFPPTISSLHALIRPDKNLATLPLSGNLTIAATSLINEIFFPSASSFCTGLHLHAFTHSFSPFILLENFLSSNFLKTFHSPFSLKTSSLLLVDYPARLVSVAGKSSCPFLHELPSSDFQPRWGKRNQRTQAQGKVHKNDYWKTYFCSMSNLYKVTSM